MRMVGLSTRSYDLEGNFILKLLPSRSNIDAITRRVSRVATIDGAVSVSDFGYVEGDRKFTLAIDIMSSDIVDAVRRIIKLYSVMVLTTSDGAFLVTPESMGVEAQGYFVINLICRGSA